MKVLVTQLCPALCDPTDYGMSGSSVHGIFQARIPEWVAFLFSRESSRPGDQTQVSCIAGRFFTTWATKQAPIRNCILCLKPTTKPISAFSYFKITLPPKLFYLFLFCTIVVVQSLSHVQLCNPMDCSMPGFPVLHCLLELAQTHVHWVSDEWHPSISSSVVPFTCLLSFPVLGEAHWQKLPTLARHHSNHLHELFYDGRS